MKKVPKDGAGRGVRCSAPSASSITNPGCNSPSIKGHSPDGEYFTRKSPGLMEKGVSNDHFGKGPSGMGDSGSQYPPARSK